MKYFGGDREKAIEYLVSMMWGIVASIVDNGIDTDNINGALYLTICKLLVVPFDDEIDVQDLQERVDSRKVWTVEQIEGMSTDEVGFWLGRFVTDVAFIVAGTIGIAGGYLIIKNGMEGMAASVCALSLPGEQGSE